VATFDEELLGLRGRTLAANRITAEDLASRHVWDSPSDVVRIVSAGRERQRSQVRGRHGRSPGR